MEDNDCQWNFTLWHITIHNRMFSLSANKASDANRAVRRIVLQQDITVPPRCQAVILAKTIYPDLSLSTEEWASKPIELMPGVRLARTLVADQPENVQLRVINTNDHSAHLQTGLSLGALEPVQRLTSDGDEADDSSDLTHLDSMFDQIDVTVPEDAKAAFIQLVKKNQSIFSKGEYDLGCATAVKHRINTENCAPVRQCLRRQPPCHQEEVDRQLDEWLQQGRIFPSQSEYASNIVIVKKKDGSLRFCVDYRQLNERTVKDSYPLPRIDDCLDSLGGGKWFSTMDLRSAYHQVAVHENDKSKTTFVTRRGTFAFNVMPFGLCNAPATFQRLMDCTMRGLQYEVCLIYLDDIIVFSNDIPTQLCRLSLIFERLKMANLKLKPSKCSFLQQSVDFLGYRITPNGIETDQRKIEAVVNWPIPRKLREVRGFLGLCGYYRRFVPNFSELAAPLHALTRKNCPFLWTENCDSSFNALKQRLTQAPVLSLPHDQGTFVLDTDASNHGIGAVLSQIQNGEEKVIFFASRLYSDAEKRYCVTRKELLAVVFYMKQMRQYLLGRPFLVRTDHAALQWLRKTPEPIGQQSRWLEVLEEFDFKIEHRPGAKHNNADALSRRPCRQCGACGTDVESPGNINICVIQNAPKDFSTSCLASAQKNDTEIGPIYAAMMQSGEKPGWETLLPASEQTKIYWTQWEFLTMRDDVLHRQHVNKFGTADVLQLVAPAGYRNEILQLAHAGFTGGHMGERRTLDQVQRRAYWAGWASETRRHCKECPQCSSYSRKMPPRQGGMQSMVVGMPWERLGVDITGPHPKSKNGFTYILTITDYFTKWADAFTIRNQEASTVAKVLVDRVFSYMGMPLQILTDQGRNFESELFNDLLRRLGIDHVRTTAYKPSTNGQIERFHLTLNAILGKVVSENQRDWDTHVPYAVAAYRATIHESTGYSPNFLMFGREVYAPIDLVLGSKSDFDKTFNSSHEFVERKLSIVQAAYQLVRERLKLSAERQKRRYDLRVRPVTFQKGDLVWLWSQRRKMNRKLKWQRCFNGPFTVLERIGAVNYRIRRSNKSKSLVVHMDKLKPYLCSIESSAVPRRDSPVEEIDNDDTESVDQYQRPRRELRPPSRYNQ